MFLMIKINKEKHAKSTGIHDFSTTPKTFPQQHATHFLLSLHVKMSFCQGHFVRHLVPFGTEISRPFCQGILLSRHPFVKASFCQGHPFVKGHQATQSCSQRQPWSTADAEGLDTSGTLCHKALEHLPQS